MDKSGKFLLPSPKFKLEEPSTPSPHFLTPQGMLMPKEKQPPPMYGPRGATYPPKFLSPLKVPTTSNQHERAHKYFCEPCEAEFHTSTDYKVHRSEHVECEIGDCTFMGHPAFMDTHIGLQHATGLYEKIKKFSTPEEIAQWKDERKKNYPTVASVEQKWKAREQRILRGEKLEGRKNRFGNKADRRPMQRGAKDAVENEPRPETETNKRQRKKNKSGKQGDKRSDTTPVAMSLPAQKEEDKQEQQPTCGGLKMFQGTGQLAGYKKVKKVETHALSSLLGMYGSDSEDESDNDENEESEEEQPVEKDRVTEVPAADEHLSPAKEEIMQSRSQEKPVEESSEPPQPRSSDDEAPEEAPIAKCSNIPDKPLSEPPKKKPKMEAPKRKTIRSGLDYRKLRTSRQNTMLEKLLEADIRHERNVLLQCVRFVVENKFFGIGEPPPT